MEELQKGVRGVGGTDEFEEVKKMIADRGKEIEKTEEDSPHHSHHHHHSSGHHHRRRHKKMSKLKAYVKRNKKKMQAVFTGSAIFIVFFVGMLAWGLSQKNEITHHGAAVTDDTNQTTTSSVVVETSFFAEEVQLVTDAVVEYLNAEANVLARDIYKKHTDSGRLDVEVPLIFSFDVRGLPKKVTVEVSEFCVSEDEALTNPKVFPFESDEGMVTLNHLKTNTQYYYRVKFLLSNGTTASTAGSFRTADTPRILTIDGIANVRDIGGWNTVSGKRIKQGLLYRGTELDGAVQSDYLLTTAGMQDMLSELGICTDMDLRSPDDNQYGTDTLGKSVEHIYYNAPMYEGVFADGQKSIVRRVFSDLADRDKYPAYLHCTYGRDRTGTICYLLEGLLGVCDDDLMRDYQLSAMYNGGVTNEGIAKFLQQLQTYPGSTTQQKVENYLLSIGVTPAEIQSIRDIFLEE